METLSVRQEPSPRPSSLDKEDTSARWKERCERKRYRRMYHRVISGLEKKGTVRFLTLTTSKVEDNSAFQKHFRQLRMRLLRRGLLTDYIRCPEYTKSGLRHEHILFRGSYIEQAYVGFLWGQLHNAPMVDIRFIYGRRRIASYMASYMAKSPSGRYSYSWGWVWKGFAGSWKRLKAYSREMAWSYNKLLTIWRWHIKLGIKVEGVIPI